MHKTEGCSFALRTAPVRVCALGTGQKCFLNPVSTAHKIWGVLVRHTGFIVGFRVVLETLIFNSNRWETGGQKRV